VEIVIAKNKVNRDFKVYNFCFQIYTFFKLFVADKIIMTVLSVIDLRCLTLLTLLGFVNVIMATTVIPPKDINELYEHSEIVVFGEVVSHQDQYGFINNFKVLESYKGLIPEHSSILLREASSRTANEWATVRGDVDFIIGEKYLLFLFKDGKGYYRPRMDALSVFQEIEKEGEVILARTQQILDLCFVGDIDPSLLGSYRSSLFRQQLETNRIAYEKAGFREFDDSAKKIKSIGEKKSSSCAIPAHCTLLIGSSANLNTQCNVTIGSLSPTKFPSDIQMEIRVADSAADDVSTNLEFTYLQDAVNTLNSLDGISITLASPLIQSCNTTGCANVAELTNNICNPSDLPVIWVFFDDPCDELDDINAPCNGTIGKGGTFAKVPCIPDQCGDLWLEAKSSYIFLNVGAGCLTAYQYTALLIHELLHGYAMNHIDGTCSALMNGVLCNSDEPNNLPQFGIKALDVECIDWMYNQCRDSENLVNEIFKSGDEDQYFTTNEITANDILLESNADIKFQAGSFIELNPEFEVEVGAIFTALVDGCTL
jgi:hypothetical protein